MAERSSCLAGFGRGFAEYNEREMTLAPGTKLGPYEILSTLGAGGMGEVYRARDSRLARDVAVKILPPAVAGDADRLRRFQLEACAASALNHPNVLTIYDVGTDEGIPYFVSELLEGETLRDRLRRGELPTVQAVELALQVASGLAAAHEKGIVHRDLKPENLFLTRDARMKILDFGLAKQEEPFVSDPNRSTVPTHRFLPALTEPGAVLGTVGYMAPEQVRGLPSDHRADIFGFGVVLYEMLTGERAFQRDSAVETLMAVLHDAPAQLAADDRRLAPDLKAVIAHCLEKEPAGRFQSARDLAFALKLPGSRTPSTTGAAHVPEGPRASVAVLPFRNMSSDREAEYFSDGMTEEIINALMKIDNLRVAARTSSFAFKGRDEDIRAIGERLGVRAILEGSVRQAAGKLRVMVQLINTADGYQLWSERYDRSLEDVFAVQDEIARAIAETLEVRLLHREDSPLVKHGTRHPEAYDLFLKGRYFFNQRSAMRAIEKFEAAIAIDPDFAPAYTGLADAYGIFAFYGGIPSQEAFAKARAAVRKANELSPDSAEVHLSAGIIEHYFGWDLEREVRELKEAVRRSPQSAAPSYWLGLVLAQTDFDEGLAHSRRAALLEPLYPAAVAGVAWPYIYTRRYAEGAEECRRALEIDANAVFPLFSLGLCHQLAGESAEAVTVYERLVNVTERRQTFSLGLLGGAYANAGRVEDARAILKELRGRASRGYVAPLHFAFVEAQLGQTEEALLSLERACDERNALTWYWMTLSELFSALRENPGFARVLAKVVPA